MAQDSAWGKSWTLPVSNLIGGERNSAEFFPSRALFCVRAFTPSPMKCAIMILDAGGFIRCCPRLLPGRWGRKVEWDMKQPGQQHQEWAKQQQQAAMQQQQAAARRHQEAAQRFQQMQQQQFTRMQQAAWWQQQQRQQQQMKAQTIRKPVPIAPSARAPFERVEREVGQLRQKMATGELSAEQVQTRLDELVVQDAQGTYWALGYDNNAWHRYDPARQTWSPGIPLGGRNLQAQSFGRYASPETHPLRGVVVFLVGLALTVAAGFLAGSLSYNILPDSLASGGSLVCAVGVWLIGLILTVRWARRVWVDE